MQRGLLAVLVLLFALLLASDARVVKADEFFLRWLLTNTRPPGEHVPLTVVEIGREPLLGQAPEDAAGGGAAGDLVRGTRSGVAPLEYALFLQAILDYKPIVVAIEPLVKWREREKDQEQVFLDQAMRVPKLLLGAELTNTPDPDVPAPEIAGFAQVRGRRGDLPSFSGVAHQPDEDLRLISTLGFVNLPDEVFDETHVPLLFQYRGEVIPSFALQALLSWARVPLGDVKIVLGSYIELPGERRIPVENDGSLRINPNAAALGRRMRLNELLLLAQQKPAGKNPALETLHNDLILARTPLNPIAPPGVFAAAIATLQSNHFVHRISVVFDCALLVLIALLAGPATRMGRLDLILATMGFFATYCLVAFALMSRFQIWVPGVVPLSAAFLVLLIGLFWSRRRYPTVVTDVAGRPASNHKT
jgi:CHASE2 domain.